MIEVLWTVIPVIILVRSPFRPSGCSISRTVRRRRRHDDQGRSVISGTGPTSIRITAISPSTPTDGAGRGPEAAARCGCSRPTIQVVLPVTKGPAADHRRDVLHSWAMPAMGVKLDAVPGRINETWVEIIRKAPITASARSFAAPVMPSCRSGARPCIEGEFAAWVERRKQEFALQRRRAARRSVGRGGLSRCTVDQTARVTCRVREENRHAARARSAHDHRRPSQAARLHAVSVLDEPQGHRHAVPDLRDHRRAHRRRLSRSDAHGADGAGHPVHATASTGAADRPACGTC